METDDRFDETMGDLKDDGWLLEHLVGEYIDRAKAPGMRREGFSTTLSAPPA